MTITADQVKQLREQTGAGMMECKKALTEAAGDVTKAVELLRKAGIAQADKRSGRSASEGLVDAYVHAGSRVGVLIEVNCETDFVARNDEFARLVRDLAMQACAGGADYVSREQVPAAVIEKEREIARAQLDGQNKPAAILDKIVEGKIGKFFAAVCLLEQPFIKDDAITVQQLVQQAVAKTGENIVVRRFVRFQLGQE